MAIEKFTFLDEVGVQKFAEALLTKANIRISERIVQEVNDSSDANHVASAAILNTLIKARDASISANTDAIGANTTAINTAKASITELGTKVDANKTSIDTVNTNLTALTEKVNGLTHLTLTTVTGPIDSITDPDPTVMYLQRDNEEDTTWMMYIWSDSKWINIGDTEVDLSNYWQKTDVDAMKEALGVPQMVSMTEAQITAAVESAFTNTNALIPPATAISISPAVVNLTMENALGGLYVNTKALTVVPTPANASIGTVVWESSNPACVSVAADGTVTAVAVGTSIITATMDGKFTATVTVAVKNTYDIKVTNGAIQYSYYNFATGMDMNQTITGTGGASSSKFVEGEALRIIADTRSNETFDHWEIVSGTVTLDNVSNASTTITMPAEAIEITAVYVPKTENVQA